MLARRGGDEGADVREEEEEAMMGDGDSRVIPAMLLWIDMDASDEPRGGSEVDDEA